MMITKAHKFLNISRCGAGVTYFLNGPFRQNNASLSKI